MRWEGQEKAELGQHLLRIYCVFRPAPGIQGPLLLLCAALLGVGTSPHVKWAGQQGWGQRPDSCPARKQTASQCQGSAIEWPPPFPGECPRGALAEEQVEGGKDGWPSLVGEGTTLSSTWWSFVYDNMWSPRTWNLPVELPESMEPRINRPNEQGEASEALTLDTKFNRCPKRSVIKGNDILV